MKAPKWDAKFADSPMHGEKAQQTLMRFATRQCASRRTAVDVGAHIGLTTIALAASFTDVHSFEPVEENFDCLEVNTKELKNVTRYFKGLGKRNGDEYGMTLPSPANSGCWRMGAGDDHKTRTLDSYGLHSVDFIKLDVEGCEGFVLEGAKDTLRESKPVVLFEDNGLGEKFYGKLWLDPKEVLRKAGYRSVARFGKNELWKI